MDEGVRSCGLKGGECTREACELWGGGRCAVAAIAIELHGVRCNLSDILAHLAGVRPLNVTRDTIDTDRDTGEECPGLICPNCGEGEVVEGIAMVDSKTGKGIRHDRCNNCGWTRDVPIDLSKKEGG